MRDVVLTLIARGEVVLRARSGVDGRFVFREVPPGNYDIDIESRPDEFSGGWSGIGSPSVAPGADVDIGTMHLYKILQILEPRESSAARPVTFRWEAFAGASAYRVMIALTTGPQIVDEYVRGTQFAFTLAASGREYYWCVLATDLAAGDLGLAETCGSVAVR